MGAQKLPQIYRPSLKALRDIKISWTEIYDFHSLGLSRTYREYISMNWIFVLATNFASC